jgi:hypothetical protein
MDGWLTNRSLNRAQDDDACATPYRWAPPVFVTAGVWLDSGTSTRGHALQALVRILMELKLCVLVLQPRSAAWGERLTLTDEG